MSTLTGISAPTVKAERERDVSNENITHWIEPWQSKSLSEMFPHVGVRGEEGTERNGVGLLASLISLIKRRKEREEDTREGAPEKVKDTERKEWIVRQCCSWFWS